MYDIGQDGAGSNDSTLQTLRGQIPLVQDETETEIEIERVVTES
jgi:hypothetical protein